jgi:hypothetical protein
MAAPEPEAKADPQYFYNGAYGFAATGFPYAYTNYNGYPYYNGRYYAPATAAAYKYYY